MASLDRSLHQAGCWADLLPLLPKTGALSPTASQALGDALLRLVRPGGARAEEILLPLASLGQVASLLAGGAGLHHTGWHDLARQLSRAAAPALRAGEARPLLLAIVALSIDQGRDAALRWGLRCLLENEATARAAPALHQALWALGLFNSEAGCADPAAWVSGLSPAAPLWQLQCALDFLGLRARRPMPYARALVEHVALPWLLEAIRTGQAETALHLEGCLIEYWLKRDESEQHYARWIGEWAKPMVALGRRHRAVFPLRHREAGTSPAASPAPPPLAFIVHNGVLLAHTEVLLLALRNLKARGGAGFTPQIWTLGGARPDFAAACVEAGASLHLPGNLPADAPLSTRLLALRADLAEAGCHAAVWICHPHLLAYAAGLGIAPRLAWWSMKFHPPIPGMDLRLCLRGGSPMAPFPMRGATWHIIPMAFQVRPRDAAVEAAARQRRQELPEGTVVMTTLMREDKLDSPPFWEVAARILQAAPQAVWRYAGRQDLPGLRACLEQYGVAERAHFIGWADVAAEAALADLYLDGWPVGSGATAAQAMAYGVPYVFRASAPEADSPAGLMDGLFVMPRRAGVLRAEEEAACRACFETPQGSLLREPESAEAQIAWALDLIRDPALRRSSGAAWARFAGQMAANPQGLAEGLRQAARRLLEA